MRADYEHLSTLGFLLLERSCLVRCPCSCAVATPPQNVFDFKHLSVVLREGDFVSHMAEAKENLLVQKQCEKSAKSLDAVDNIKYLIRQSERKFLHDKKLRL